MASIHTQETAAGRRYIVRWREAGKQRGRTFHRKKDAQALQADVIRRVQLGELFEDDGGTLGDFLDGWLERYSLRVRPSTTARRAAALRSLPDNLRHDRLGHLRPAAIDDAVTAVARRAPRQAQLALASLKLALRDAAKRGLRFDRRILELASPSANPREPRFLTWGQVQEIAEWLPDRHARLVMVAALSGLRRGEIVALKWGDVDLEKGTVRVRAGKTEAARRVVDLPATAVELLREQLGSVRASESVGRHRVPVQATSGPPLNAPDEAVTQPKPSGRAEEPQAGNNWLPGDPLSETLNRSAVFPNNQGGHLDGHNFSNRWWVPAVRATGHQGTPFHALRHSYASMLAHANVNPKVAAGLMGHADGGALFLRRYSHLYPGAGRQAAEALEGIL